MSKEQNKGHLRLLSETRQRIHALEDAIRQINSTKKQLKQNVGEVKSQIHAAISRQLETLRSREVWLLEQVDVIHQAKEDVLKVQHDKLQRHLGALQSGLEFTEDQEAPMEGRFDLRLSRSLDRLDKLDLHPQETAIITFHADTLGLREVIRQFGQVDSKGLPLDKVFADPSTEAASLPRAFEDYGDAEHHVLYKTVEEIRKEKSQDTSICVTIPRLSQRPQDSLFSSAPTSRVSTPSYMMEQHFNFPPFKADLAPWIAKHEQAATPSIAQWLVDIKNGAEIEEDDFEMISSSHTPSVSESESIVTLGSEQPSGLSTIKPGEAFGYFKQVASTPPSAWVKRRLSASCTAEPYRTMAYFRQIANSTKIWLADYNERKESEKAIEMKNLHSLADVTESKEAWLSKAHIDMDADVDESDGYVITPMTKFCPANEPCKSFSDCICEENCGSLMKIPKGMTAGSSAAQEWLLKPKSPEVMEDIMSSSLFTYFKTISNDTDYWLPAGGAKEELFAASDLFPYFGLVSNEMEDWLLDFTTGASTNTDCMATSCPNVMLFKKIASSSLSQWLPDGQAEEEAGIRLTEDKAVLKSLDGNLHNWLSLKSSGSVDFDSDVEKWISLDRYKNEKSSDWLLKHHLPKNQDGAGAGTSDQTVLFGPFKKYTSSQKWLLPGDTPLFKETATLTENQFVTDVTKAFRKLYFEDNFKQVWLLGQDTTPHENQEDKEEEEEEEDSVWLMKKESRQNSPDKVFKFQTELFPAFLERGVNLQEWLLNTDM
jgi:nuclear receptor coactivator 4